MAEQDENVLSPTVTKVLEEFASALSEDAAIPDNTVDRLDGLLRKGKVPKVEEISAAVFPPAEGDAE
jgi:hypothetical protein